MLVKISQSNSSQTLKFWLLLQHKNCNKPVELPFIKFVGTEEPKRPSIKLSVEGVIVVPVNNKNGKTVLNSLPNDKILDWFKLKAFADDTWKIVKMMIYVLDRVENIVGKGENAGYQHFLLFPQWFQKPSCPRSLKVRIACQDWVNG